MKTFASGRTRLRIASLVLAAAFGVLAPSVRAETSVVVDVASGKVLSQKDASARWYPASTTKLMTAYVVLRALDAKRIGLDAPVVVTRLAATQPPSKMGYKPGSVLRLDVALRAMLVKSANDLAMAIAQTMAGGSQERFVSAMNAEAARLGMRDTHFINPNGLPGPGQYSSAKDLAILATAIRREFPAFSDLFSTEAISNGKTLMKNGNGLLGHYAGADGMKTGYICASGFNLVASATRDGRTLVAVVLGAEGPVVRERHAAELLENGFRADPKGAKTLVGDLPASSGAPADISDEVCSQTGRTARANAREETAGDDNFGSPYMQALKRPRVAVPVALGGAAGGDGIDPGVSLIAAYGIPIPTWRPIREGEAADGTPAPTGSGSPAPAAEKRADEPADRAEPVASAALRTAD